MKHLTGFAQIAGGIDLSMGSLVCLCSTVFGLLIVQRGWSVPAAFAGMLGLGIAAGLVQRHGHNAAGPHSQDLHAEQLAFARYRISAGDDIALA